jgi:hypothetical protein
MGTISAVMRALDAESGRPRRLLYAGDAYFELLSLLPLLENLLPNRDDDELFDGDIFYLDSVTTEDHFPLLQKSLEKLHLILFDTTCYEIGSPLIERVIARAAEERVPLQMMRSHLKLDCLATEYARQGSAVFWLPPKPSPKLVERVRKLRHRLLEELARTGAMPYPTMLWPLGSDAEFRRLTRERHLRMMAAQRRAGRALLSAWSRVRVTEPHHGCFLLLAAPATSQTQAARDRVQLAERLCAAGIEAHPAASFGYDFVSLTGLPFGKLRLAISDLPDELVDRLVEIFVDYWHMYI